MTVDPVSGPAMPGRIVLAATPIGNVDDASPRLRRLLAEADIVAAEDTRRLHGLAARLGVTVTGRVLSNHEHNEMSRVAELVEAASGGATVLVVSDAGMPTVSDPGFPLVQAAAAAGVPVTVAPGPSAVLTALALSGLPTDRFCFEGFLPRRAGQRDRALAGLARERRTLVFFEAPHRLVGTLAAMAAAWGDERPAAVCRELTKTYEEVRRGPLGELAAWAGSGEVRGEVVVVVGGAPDAPTASPEALAAEVVARADAGERLKDVVGEVAAATGVGKRELYAAALAARSAARAAARR